MTSFITSTSSLSSWYGDYKMMKLLKIKIYVNRFKSYLLILLCITNSGFSLIAQVSNAELTSQETKIAVRNGRLYKTITTEIRILNRGGENYTKVEIPYSKLVKISKLEAYIRDSGGTIIKKLGKSEITDRSATPEGAFYQDNFIREFTLKHNSYPYTIFYTYQLQEEQFFRIDYWIPVISRSIPTLKASLSLEVPEDYKILYDSQLTDSFTVDTSSHVRSYFWSASYHDLIGEEIYAPSNLQFLPHVIIIPEKFNFDRAGSSETWKSFGNFNNDLAEGLDDLPPAEKTNIRNLVSGIDDPVLKVKKLYNYMQDNTRYINVTIETGGLKPYPASYVAANKYGDCKALSNYLKAVLEAAGIKSYYTLINAGDPTLKILKNFPGQQFNHVILCVPAEKDTIWLDCTSDNAFNYLGTFTQDRDALMIDKDNSQLIRTPALTEEDVRVTRKVVVSQNLANQFIARFSNSCRGEDYEALFYLAHSIDNKRKEQIFADRYLENGYDLVDFSITEAERDVPEIYLSYSAVVTRHYKFYGNDLIIDILPFPVPAFEDPGSRKLPVQIDYPISRVDTLEYEIPAGYKISNKPADQKTETGFGKYEINTMTRDNRVLIIKKIFINKGEYPPDKYKELFLFTSKLSETEKNNRIIANKKI